ncbi:MAG: hypothetical protein ACW986_20120 [Promethearchaeota archaeon]
MSKGNYGKLIFLMVLGILGIIFGVLLLLIVPFSVWGIGSNGMIPFSILPGGIFLVIYSLIKSKRRKKLEKIFDSMSQSDVSKMFDCPKNESKGVVKFIKLEKDQILVRHRCPIQGVRLLRIPIRFKDQCISHFRDTVFRCFKCGEESTIDHVKYSGPFTLVNLSCPTHGTNLPYHKIWNSIYTEISNEEIPAPQSAQTQPIPSEKIKFCPNCGEKFQGEDQIVCPNCGSER